MWGSSVRIFIEEVVGSFAAEFLKYWSEIETFYHYLGVFRIRHFFHFSEIKISQTIFTLLLFLIIFIYRNLLFIGIDFFDFCLHIVKYLTVNLSLEFSAIFCIFLIVVVIYLSTLTFLLHCGQISCWSDISVFAKKHWSWSKSWWINTLL